MTLLCLMVMMMMRKLWTENERQALQEQRDIELARQLHEKEARKIAKIVCYDSVHVCI